jgi:two-component system phosphate regulon sensor histidine kinase PhoR
MDPWPILAVALGVAWIIALAAGRARSARLDRIRRAVGARTDADAERAAERLTTRIDRLELELTDERRDHDLLTDLLDVGIIDLDARLRIVAANPAAHAFLDRGPGTLLGMDALEAFLDPQVEQIARAALEQGAAAGEVRLRGADGPVLIVRARRSTAGGAWLVLEDVSELRRLQQIRAEFIDNLSHELRTPLTTVSLLAETLTREAAAAGTTIPPKMRDRMNKIEVETGHLVQMVTELLDLSRIESGGTIGLLDEVDMGRLARSSTERLKLFAERQGVRLRVDVEPRLPPVRGDESRLGQVLVNLLHNAVKFSPNGGDVTVFVRRDERAIVVSVEDHGVGVPRAAQQRIFERFYKVDRARVRGEAGGTGLGLAISRHVVEQHGGRIWVDSTEGRGSTFSFAIPLTEGTLHA